MPECPSCQAAEKNPLSGLYQANCDSCKARAIANGMEVYESSKCGKVTPRLKTALQSVWGESWESVGLKMVKSWANRQKEKA